jgi:DnaJ-class molecular chaperone
MVLVGAMLRRTFEQLNCEDTMRKSTEEKKKPCKNCEGKGTLKKGDKVVRCQRCGGTGIKPS